jgi:hypothetical protein
MEFSHMKKALSDFKDACDELLPASVSGVRRCSYQIWYKRFSFREMSAVVGWKNPPLRNGSGEEELRGVPGLC